MIKGEKNMITLKNINEMLNERTPRFRIEKINFIKNADRNLFDKVWQRDIITLNNKTYWYNSNKNKYELC